jgi:hypothetical protein
VSFFSCGQVGGLLVVSLGAVLAVVVGCDPVCFRFRVGCDPVCFRFRVGCYPLWFGFSVGLKKSFSEGKFSKIKNTQNHYNRPKFKPTYYETKCSPEKMDKKINTQKLSTYYVWLDIIVIFRHFLKTNYENFGLLKLQMVITQSIFIRFTR